MEAVTGQQAAEWRCLEILASIMPIFGFFEHHGEFHVNHPR